MHFVKPSNLPRMFAVISILLVIYAQIQLPAGDVNAPLQLLKTFHYFPADWSLTIFLMVALPMRDRVALTGILGLAALTGGIASRVAGGVSGAEVRMGAMVGMGLAPYLFALLNIARRTGQARQDWIDMLALGSLVHITALAVPYFRDGTALASPHVIDRQLAIWDEAFGLQISSAISIALIYLPSIKIAVFSAYSLIQIPIVIIAALCWRRPETHAACVLPTFMIASIIGFVCYHFAPAIGPYAYFGPENPVLHATPAFLSGLPSVDFVPTHPRNSMPSLHFTWALLVFLYSRGLPFAARALAATFTALTVIATLGLRQHYLVDLIVALPLALLVRSLCAFELGWNVQERWMGAGLGLTMLALWIALIPTAGYMLPSTVIALSIVTSATAMMFESGLARAEQRARAAAAAGASRKDSPVLSGGASAPQVAVTA